MRVIGGDPPSHFKGFHTLTDVFNLSRRGAMDQSIRHDQHNIDICQTATRLKLGSQFIRPSPGLVPPHNAFQEQVSQLMREHLAMHSAACTSSIDSLVKSQVYMTTRSGAFLNRLLPQISSKAHS